MSPDDVAIIGAGPGGIACARYLKAHGLRPLLIESHDSAGGQWNAANRNSGVWPQMRTNTFLEATRFSDAPYGPNISMFPRNTEVLAYLQDYAAAHGLLADARFNTELTHLQRTDSGYRLILRTGDDEDVFDVPRVIVATGRYNKPNIPPIPGLKSFSGELGVKHAFHYKNPDAYHGKHVVVGGGAISALEIASDLAMLGAASVHMSQRRQRYVVPKMFAGVPIEYFAFTYGGAEHANRNDPEAELAFLLKYGGDPARYGAPAPHPDVAKAGATGSQHYLNLVAEDRLTPVPWFEHIDGRKVTFADGREVNADAIIIGTGFDLNLPFLSDEISAIVQNNAKGLQLADFTFHPDLPNLAFVGLWAQQGSYPVPIEQQARYVAYTWAGVIPPRSDAEMRAALAACAAEGHHSGYQYQNEMALRFARLCGTDPAAIGDPGLVAKIRASATTGLIYRLTGPDALPDGVATFQAQYEKYGPPDAPTPEAGPVERSAVTADYA